LIIVGHVNQVIETPDPGHSFSHPILTSNRGIFIARAGFDRGRLFKTQFRGVVRAASVETLRSSYQQDSPYRPSHIAAVLRIPPTSGSIVELSSSTPWRHPAWLFEHISGDWPCSPEARRVILLKAHDSGCATAALDPL
jgi:hypothetical protein